MPITLIITARLMYADDVYEGVQAAPTKTRSSENADTEIDSGNEDVPRKKRKLNNASVQAWLDADTSETPDAELASTDTDQPTKLYFELSSAELAKLPPETQAHYEVMHKRNVKQRSNLLRERKERREQRTLRRKHRGPKQDQVRGGSEVQEVSIT